MKSATVDKGNVRYKFHFHPVLPGKWDFTTKLWIARLKGVPRAIIRIFVSNINN